MDKQNHISEERKNLIEIKGLSHRYKGEAALSKLNLALSSPKIYGLIGRNGAGKTTLLSLLGAYRKVQEGELRVFGESPFENPGVVSEIAYHGKPDFVEEDEKVRDYFHFYKRYRTKFDMDYALEMAEIFEIPLQKPINKLSQGKQSALMGILGLACKTEVTIFDEVYLAMDAPSRTRFYKEVLRQQEEKPRLMILSTHLVSEMEYLFDHVVIMDKGSIMLDEPIDKVLERGFSITGEKSKVEDYTKGLQVLSREELGPIQKAVVFGSRDEISEVDAKELNLEISNVSLQDLFIHLTEKKKEEAPIQKKGGEEHE